MFSIKIKKKIILDSKELCLLTTVESLRTVLNANMDLAEEDKRDQVKYFVYIISYIYRKAKYEFVFFADLNFRKKSLQK